QHFKFASIPNLKLVFRRLERKQFLVSAQPEGRASRRKYYRLGREGIKIIRSIGSEMSRERDKASPFRKGSNLSVPSTITTQEPPQASSSAMALEEIMKRYPRAEVEKEYKKCAQYYADLARRGRVVTAAVTAQRMKRWMAKAEPRLSLPKREVLCEAEQPTAALSEEVDSVTHARFLEDFAAHKAKKIAITAKFQAQPSEHDE